MQPLHSLRASLRSLQPPDRPDLPLAHSLHQAILAGDLVLSDTEAAVLSSLWEFWARESQLSPPGKWTFWLIQAGRGFGKTRSGAEWIVEKALRYPRSRCALVAPTIADVRDTMVEGESGLLSILRPGQLRGGLVEKAWNRSINELYLKNGSRFRGFTSEVPQRLRGPNHHFAWGDEVSSWDDAGKGDVLDTTWSNMVLGLRLPARPSWDEEFWPQAVLTTTPKPNRLTKQLLKKRSLVATRGSTFENMANLAEAFRDEILGTYQGTRIGRQELEAELLEDVEGALWTHSLLDKNRVEKPPLHLHRIVVAVDPNVSDTEASNEAGIVVCGFDSHTQHGYVLEDLTVGGGPDAWTREAVRAYGQHHADGIVAEKNNGGDLVKIALRAVDPRVPVKLVSASRGKRPRAEPVAALYEQGKVHHVGAGFEDLEDQMCQWTPDTDESPDRMDALVWGLTELMLQGGRAESREYAPRAGAEPVTRRGDLVLVGDRYVDGPR